MGFRVLIGVSEQPVNTKRFDSKTMALEYMTEMLKEIKAKAQRLRVARLDDETLSNSNYFIDY